MMRHAGGLVSSLATGGKLCREAAEALAAIRERAASDLRALGIAGEGAEIVLDRAKARLIETVALCESPIEQVMLTALSHMVVPRTDCFPPALHDMASGDPWPARPVVVAPQFVIARFRLDFLVAVGRRWVAVECDGRDYHDSLEQRARDKARDHYLEALGVTTLRYSGRWIWQNKARVADEIAAVVEQQP